MEGLLSQRKGRAGYGAVPSQSAVSPVHQQSRDWDLQQGVASSADSSSGLLMNHRGKESAGKSLYKEQGGKRLARERSRSTRDREDRSRGSRAVWDQGSIKSGRQRKKSAARSANEFKARAKKRIYFCCLTSSVIDVDNLCEQIQASSPGPASSVCSWQCTAFQEVLHIWIPAAQRDASREQLSAVQAAVVDSATEIETETEAEAAVRGDVTESNVCDDTDMSAQSLWSQGAREIFVFGFGSIVLWGFDSTEEEEGVADYLRRFSVKQELCLTLDEFRESEDDMAFGLKKGHVQSHTHGYSRESALCGFRVENDLVDIPSTASAKQRLSLSFALAQSSILSVFEARIQQHVEEYRYIPETFARNGKVHLTAKQLGNMIGEVLKVRHDVNLNSEILDTPDWFWSQRGVEDLYKFVSDYLEMRSRTEILNKRVDMLKEMLEVLQGQHENAHSVKLEWIVIILIVLSVFIELITLFIRLNSS